MSELSMVPIIPLDIIETIVDILINSHSSDDSDTTGLQDVKAFSLTCQSFLPFCRKHIFSSIQIKMENRTWASIRVPTGEAFEHLLSETPAIAKYVRQLTIHIIQESHSWPSYSFDRVPRQLTRLQSLKVSIWRHSLTHSSDWNDLSSSIQCSILNLIHLPTLSHLGLTGIGNFPISNLITCANLKHLSIEDLHIATGHDEVASSSLQNPMQLQALDIQITGSETLGLLAARCPDGRTVLDFTVLEKISISFDLDFAWRDAAGPTQEIFRKAQRLTDMRLTIDVDDINFRDMEFAKTVTPSLQTLRRIEFNIGTIDGVNDDPLAELCDELEDISGKNGLESIKIQVYVQTDEDCRTGAEWGRLEKVLLKSGWPMLKHVSLTIVLNKCSKRRVDSPCGMALKSLPKTQFAGLMSSKTLDFRFSVEEKLI